jgi:hypothetical protein
MIYPWDESLAIKRNAAWIRRKIKQGYEIIDIGIDPTRNTRSRFYQMEKQIITRALYPIFPYDTIKMSRGRK